MNQNIKKKPERNISKIIITACKLLRIRPNIKSECNSIDLPSSPALQYDIKNLEKISKRKSSFLPFYNKHSKSGGKEFVSKWLRRCPSPLEGSEHNSPYFEAASPKINIKKKLSLNKIVGSSPSSNLQKKNCKKIFSIISNVEGLQAQNKIIKRSLSKKSFIMAKHLNTPSNHCYFASP